jgi:peptidyl-prolyl cis-trans isomerase SurA
MIADSLRYFRLLPLAALLALPVGPAWAQFSPAPVKTVKRAADYIVAVVNNDLVTQTEVEQRMARARDEAARSGAKLPAEEDLRKQVVDALIEERVQITFARDSGQKVEDPEIDRAIDNIASMNKLTLAELRERLKADGMDYNRFRSNLRDQILSERTREREVQSRIKITDAELDAVIAEQRAARAANAELNIAQILVTVPEGATDEVVAQRRARLQQAQDRLKAGEPFLVVAKAMSEDGNKDNGGEIGARTADRLPDLFVEAVKDMAVGAVAAQPVRSGAGFHLLKLLSRSDGNASTVVQTRARHILLRPSARLSQDAAQRRLAEFRTQVLSGKRSFEDLAREFSEDGSASKGGDLGWASPGNFVPEFEITMNALQLGAISTPIVSRFGVHIIQVVERREVAQDPKQAREQARATLRERKFEAAYTEWNDELRSRAFIEMREPPL